MHYQKRRQNPYVYMAASTMTASEAQERLVLIKTETWSFDQMKTWFGVDLAQQSSTGFLAQYRTWAEQFRPKKTVIDLTNKLINRPVFSLFLQRRELVSIRSAAVQWGMDEASFLKVLSEASKKAYLSESEANGEFPGIYRSSLIRDFHKRFPELERTIFGSYSGFIRRLHEQIQEVLGVTATPLYCLTSEIIGEKPPDFAHDFDIITNEPMGLGFQVWLETGKPIQLRPDSCSWATYFRFENLLKDQIMGRLDVEMEKYRDVIKKFFNI